MRSRDFTCDVCGTTEENIPVPYIPLLWVIDDEGTFCDLCG